MVGGSAARLRADLQYETRWPLEFHVRPLPSWPPSQCSREGLARMRKRLDQHSQSRWRSALSPHFQPACFRILFSVPGELITGLARNRDAPAFHRMLELAMTASRSNQGPAVVGQH